MTFEIQLSTNSGIELRRLWEFAQHVLIDCCSELLCWCRQTLVSEIRDKNESVLVRENPERSLFAFRTHVHTIFLSLPLAFRNSKNGLHALKTRESCHTFLSTHTCAQKNHIFPNQSSTTSATSDSNQINLRMTVKVWVKCNHTDCAFYSCKEILPFILKEIVHPEMKICWKCSNSQSLYLQWDRF